MAQKFAQTIYESPDGWGETEYADYKTMQSEIAGLHKLGDDWKSCDIGECDEWTLVSANGKTATYSHNGAEHEFKIDGGLYYPVR